MMRERGILFVFLCISYMLCKLKSRQEPQPSVSVEGKECPLFRFFWDLTVCLYNLVLQLCLQISKLLLEK